MCLLFPLLGYHSELSEFNRRKSSRISTIETLTRHADLQLQTRLSTSKKSVERLGFIKDIFAANPDNKMALKLFGNKAAVLLEQQRQAQKGKGVIHPFSTFRWYWDILLISFISMHVILLPVSIAFLSDDISLHWLILNGISDFFFIADICLNFRTGIVDPNNQEEIILDRKIITRKYLRGWFFVDLLSSLPFDYAYFVASSSSAQQTLIKASRALRILKLAKLLSLLRLLRVSRLMRYITRFEEVGGLSKSYQMKRFNFRPPSPVRAPGVYDQGRSHVTTQTSDTGEEEVVFQKFTKFNENEGFLFNSRCRIEPFAVCKRARVDLLARKSAPLEK